LKSVLVTGCSGYIGQHLCAYLKGSDYEVWGVDIVEPSERAKQYIDEYRYLDITNEEDFVAGDWDNKQFDAVVHLAALVQVGESVNYPINYYETNVQGTINCLRYLNYENFVFASTGAASTPPWSPYALSKIAAEQCIRQLLDDIPYTIFRFFNVIGSEGFEPTNPDGLFYNLRKAEKTGTFNLYGDDYNTPDGSAIRDYVHVIEICYALELAVRKPSCVPGAEVRPYVENLGHGKGYSVKQIIQAYKEKNNAEFDVVVKPKRDGDLEKSVLDDVSPYMTQLYLMEELVKV
jgi:UDP-glucose 4-epimerase